MSEPEPEPGAERHLCEECGRAPAGADDEARWRFFPNRVRGLIPYCPECAVREFGPAD